MPPRFIVAEISKNWPSEQPRLLADMFEEAINTNFLRGYNLVDWKLVRQYYKDPERLNETIIAIFKLG